MRIGGEERWIASEDAGLYRDALRRRAARRAARGVPRGGRGAARPRLVRRYARTHGPFTTRELGRPLRAWTSGPVLRELERAGDLVRGELRPGGSRARVVRPRGAAPPAARLAGRAAQGGRARRAAGARALPARLAGRGRLAARRRRRRPPARGAGAAAGRGAGARGVGAGRAAAARGRLLARLARPAVRRRRARVGRRRGARAQLRQGRPATSARTPAGSGRRRSRATRPGEPLHDAHPRAAGSRRGVLDRPARRRRERRAGRAAGGALGPGVGRRGDQRRVRPAARAAALAGPRAARRRAPLLAPPPARRAAGAGPLVAHRAAVRATRPPTARACARSPSCCWSATASSPARPCWPRASPAASPSLYGELANLETLGTARRGYFVEGLGGAQFALPAAIERLRGLRARRARRARWCWPPPTRPTRTAPRCPGPSARTRPRGGPSRVPGAYVVTLDAEPVLYVERGGKGLLAAARARATRLAAPRRSRRWPTTCGAAGCKRLAHRALRRRAGGGLRATSIRWSRSASARARGS